MKQKVFAFIDSQNLNLGIRSQGWNLDWQKFRQYLHNKYNVSNAYLFIGKVSGNESLYEFLTKCGYILIFKPTLHNYIKRKVVTKGNVDAELVLHTMIEYKNYKKAIIVSGDGKLLKILTPTKHYSSLLRKFNQKHYIVCMELLKSSLEQKTAGIRGRSKP